MRARRIIGAAATVTAAFGVPTAAGATQDYVGTTPPQVESLELVKPVQVLGVEQSRDPATLPVTGGDLAGMALFGAGAVALGTVLVRRSRPAHVVA
jgi:hypothetical protein